MSSRAHQMLYEWMTGIPVADKMVTLMIHFGALLAVLSSCKNRIKRMSQEGRHERNSRRRKARHVDQIALLDIKVLRMATIPVLLGSFLYGRADRWVDSVAILSLTLFLNGMLLFLPSRIAQGNKDCRNMSRIDSIVTGLGGVVALIPGFSRIGSISSAGMIRGVGREPVVEMALMLSIPALFAMVLFDMYAVAVAKTALTLWGMLVYILMAAVSFASSYLSIMIIRFVTSKASFNSFGYYSLGMALFSFILYLTI